MIDLTRRGVKKKRVSLTTAHQQAGYARSARASAWQQRERVSATTGGMNWLRSGRRGRFTMDVREYPVNELGLDTRFMYSMLVFSKYDELYDDWLGVLEG